MEHSKCNDVRVSLGVSVSRLLVYVMCIIPCFSPLQNEAVFSQMVSAGSRSFYIYMQKMEKLELQRCVNVTGLTLTPISC